MAKSLLWLIVIVNMILGLLIYLDTKEMVGLTYPILIAISVLAICESIEKLKK